MANQKAAASLFEQIVEEAMRGVSASEQFDDAMVAELRKLAENRQLSQAEAVAKVLERHKE